MVSQETGKLICIENAVKEKAQSVPTPNPMYVYTDILAVDVAAPQVIQTNAPRGIAVLTQLELGYVVLSVIS